MDGTEEEVAEEEPVPGRTLPGTGLTPEITGPSEAGSR